MSVRIIAYKAAHPEAKTNAKAQQDFITNDESRVLAEQARLWSGVKKLDHWTGLNLKQRVMQLKGEYEEIYESATRK